MNPLKVLLVASLLVVGLAPVASADSVVTDPSESGGAWKLDIVEVSQDDGWVTVTTARRFTPRYFSRYAGFLMVFEQSDVGHSIRISGRPHLLTAVDHRSGQALKVEKTGHRSLRVRTTLVSPGAASADYHPDLCSRFLPCIDEAPDGSISARTVLRLAR